MKKLYREHRGGLAESLATTIECPNGLTDIVKHYENDKVFSNIRIRKENICDDRLPEWETTHYVIADFLGGGSGVVGMCNFYEDIQ